MIFLQLLFKAKRFPIFNIQFCFFLLLVGCSQQTYASFTDDLSIGNAKALALANAVTADPPSIDSINFNPAGLSRLKGRQMFIKGVFGIFNISMDIGGYGPYEQNLVDTTASYYKDANGNLTPLGQYILHNPVLNTHSNASGVSVMIPGRGLTKLPAAIGAMGGASYSPPGSKFTFATDVYSPMMNGLTRKPTDPGRFAQQQAAFTVLTYFSPSIAYQVTDNFSVGLSVNFNYVGMGLNLPIREPHAAIFFADSPFIADAFCNGKLGQNDPSIPGLNICTTVVSPFEQYATLKFQADQMASLSFNTGLLWSPEPWLTFGVAYLSPINAKLHGNFSFPIAPNFKQYLYGLHNSGTMEAAAHWASILGVALPTADQIKNDASGKMDIAFQIPQRLNAGVSIQVTPKWKVNADLKWTEWSAFSKINLNFGTDVGLLMWGSLADSVGTRGANGITANSVKYQLGLQDSTYWAMGTEYQYTDRLALRAGVEWRPSAVPKAHPNAFVPINDGYLYSAGFKYQLKDDSRIDFGVGFFESKTHYPPCTADLGNGCNPYNVVYPVYAGQDLKTDVKFLMLELMYQRHF